MSSDREDRNVNLTTGLVFKMTGCYDHFGVSRLYKLFIKDKQAIRHSVDKVLSSASAALCSGTGQLVETDGRAILKEAYSFLRP